ncbi:FAD:protein FMN transferase [Thioalkalivibrio sp.]|uniref:FAD:protein FMN transferase n=1 Tax=Thioalkalivibrio sp. TaxID=2093813 RepID=UPI003975DAD2
MNPRPLSPDLPAILRLLLPVFLALLLSACGRDGPDTDRLTFQALGTLVDVTLHPADTHDLTGIESALRDELDAMHAAWHAWEPGPLGRTNRLLEQGVEFDAPASVLPLIERARELERLTDGLFNPALGRLVSAWGFHQDEPSGPPPSEETLATMLADPPRVADIERDGMRLRGGHPELQLDFGGLAKGLAVARSLELLTELGVEHAIVNAGGDLMTLGEPAGRPWRIGVRDPRGTEVLAAISLGPGEALFSSGDYERGYEWESRRIHHVIDPRTGRPSQGIASATVLHGDPALADAAATTLMIAGPQQWPAYARRLGVDHALLVLADGSVELTPAMEGRVDFRQDLDYRLRESGPGTGPEPR